MKKSIALIASLIGVVLCGGRVLAAEQKQRPDVPVLPASEYRTPLEEIIVRGRSPYWQREEAPRWDKPKVEAPVPGAAPAGRLQWTPPYTRDERDDYDKVRDQLNPQPRTKLFELKF